MAGNTQARLSCSGVARVIVVSSLATGGTRWSCVQRLRVGGHFHPERGRPAADLGGRRRRATPGAYGPLRGAARRWAAVFDSENSKGNVNDTIRTVPVK